MKRKNPLDMIKRLLALFLTLLFSVQTFAQTPEMYPPPDPEPVIWTNLNVVLFIILPILLVIAFILYRRWVKRRKEK